MRIRTDDNIYRVDAVWLGPPRATFPFRARYVAWGVGTFVFLLVLTVFRQMGISLFWSIAWGLVATIGLTMVICARISHERPLTAVLKMWILELMGPREVTTGRGGAMGASGLKLNTELPKPRRRAPPRLKLFHRRKGRSQLRLFPEGRHYAQDWQAVGP